MKSRSATISTGHPQRFIASCATAVSDVRESLLVRTAGTGVAHKPMQSDHNSFH